MKVGLELVSFRYQSEVNFCFPIIDGPRFSIASFIKSLATCAHQAHFIETTSAFITVLTFTTLGDSNGVPQATPRSGCEI